MASVTLWKVLIAPSCPTLCDPMDGSPPGPLSMGFPFKNTGLLFPSPFNLPNPEIKPGSLCLLHWQEDSLPMAPPPGKPICKRCVCVCVCVCVC